MSTVSISNKTDWTLQEIIEEFKANKFECEGGSLETNAAFIALQGMADENATLAKRAEIAVKALCSPGCPHNFDLPEVESESCSSLECGNCWKQALDSL